MVTRVIYFDSKNCPEHYIAGQTARQNSDCAVYAKNYSTAGWFTVWTREALLLYHKNLLEFYREFFKLNTVGFLAIQKTANEIRHTPKVERSEDIEDREENHLTWLTRLWLDNEEKYYRHVLALVEDTDDIEDSYNLGEQIAEYIENEVIPCDLDGLAYDYVSHCTRFVDWTRLAGYFLQNYWHELHEE